MIYLKLENCPICKGEVFVREMEGNEDGIKFMAVECSKCNIEFRVKEDSVRQLTVDAGDDALGVWNRLRR